MLGVMSSGDVSRYHGSRGIDIYWRSTYCSMVSLDTSDICRYREFSCQPPLEPGPPASNYPHSSQLLDKRNKFCIHYSHIIEYRSHSREVSETEINSSIDDWSSDWRTLTKADWAEVEPAAGGYACSSASKHFTRILLWRQTHIQEQRDDAGSLWSIQAVACSDLLTDVSKCLVDGLPEGIWWILVVDHSLKMAVVKSQ